MFIRQAPGDTGDLLNDFLFPHSHPGPASPNFLGSELESETALGFLGDRFASWSPLHGRALVGQMSIVLGAIPLSLNQS